MRDHYKKWMDEPIPALLGLTPREAAKTSEGKARLEVLLEDLVPGTLQLSYQGFLFIKMHFVHADWCLAPVTLTTRWFCSQKCILLMRFSGLAKNLDLTLDCRA